jgi:hypothetical protein
MRLLHVPSLQGVLKQGNIFKPFATKYDEFIVKSYDSVLYKFPDNSQIS